MLYKTNIEIVTGFLGTGKTNFINSLLSNTLVKHEKIAIIQCEEGKTKIENIFIKNNNVIIKNLHNMNELNNELIKEIIIDNRPFRIIIEKNGTVQIEKLLKLLEHSDLKHLCKVTSIYYITDATTFKIFIKNMGNLLLDSIYNSHLIVITNVDKITKDKLQEIIQILEGFNQDAYIIEVNNIDCIGPVLNEKKNLFSGFLKELFVCINNFYLRYIDSWEKDKESKNCKLLNKSTIELNEFQTDESTLENFGDKLTKLFLIIIYILFIVLIYHQIKLYIFYK